MRTFQIAQARTQQTWPQGTIARLGAPMSEMCNRPGQQGRHDPISSPRLDRRRPELNDTVCVAGRHVKEKEETNRIWEL